MAERKIVDENDWTKEAEGWLRRSLLGDGSEKHPFPCTPAIASYKTLEFRLRSPNRTGEPVQK
jgi:hypothetical protein